MILSLKGKMNKTKFLITGGAGFLGINLCRYSNKQALIRNYKWYLEHYEEYNKTGISYRVPWKQGILALVGLFF
jgi:nucleoside-diphosphate-sugar epimerase